MYRSLYYIPLAIILSFSITLTAGARQDGESERKGEQIHESTINEYSLAYNLIDMGGAGVEMEGHEGHQGSAPTHHLMVYIVDPDGNTVDRAKVGFLVKGPEGAEQKVMAMGMGDGYGADISLQHPGEYTIRTKAVSGDETLLDSFEYKAD
ncbi:MAG: hypothetical protein KGY42_02995 [Desulfobacterales bacterium]|nr:hypothetical protein [Desulfobacterales bacterium]MBS3754508.1 hypothetical protein [Desulfobacterales bacterium]